MKMNNEINITESGIKYGKKMVEFNISAHQVEAAVCSFELDDADYNKENGRECNRYWIDIELNCLLWSGGFDCSRTMAGTELKPNDRQKAIARELFPELY
jgi:hypothetical protein